MWMTRDRALLSRSQLNTASEVPAHPLPHGRGSTTEPRGSKRSSANNYDTAFILASGFSTRPLYFSAINYRSNPASRHSCRGCLGRGDGSTQRQGVNMTFGIYLIGYLIFIVGLALGAHLLHVPPKWIGVGVVILTGIGVISGVKTARTRDAA